MAAAVEGTPEGCAVDIGIAARASAGALPFAARLRGAATLAFEVAREREVDISVTTRWLCAPLYAPVVRVFVISFFAVAFAFCLVREVEGGMACVVSAEWFINQQYDQAGAGHTGSTRHCGRSIIVPDATHGRDWRRVGYCEVRRVTKLGGASLTADEYYVPGAEDEVSLPPRATVVEADAGLRSGVVSGSVSEISITVGATEDARDVDLSAVFFVVGGTATSLVL